MRRELLHDRFSLTYTLIVREARTISKAARIRKGLSRRRER